MCGGDWSMCVWCVCALTHMWADTGTHIMYHRCTRLSVLIWIHFVFTFVQFVICKALVQKTDPPTHTRSFSELPHHNRLRHLLIGMDGFHYAASRESGGRGGRKTQCATITNITESCSPQLPAHFTHTCTHTGITQVLVWRTYFDNVAFSWRTLRLMVYLTFKHTMGSQW